MLALMAGIAVPISAMDHGSSDSSGLLSWKTAGYVVGGYVLSVGTAFAVHYAYNNLWAKSEQNPKPAHRQPERTTGSVERTGGSYSGTLAAQPIQQSQEASTEASLKVPAVQSRQESLAIQQPQAVITKIQKTSSAKPIVAQLDDGNIEGVDFTYEFYTSIEIDQDGNRFEDPMAMRQKPYSPEVRAKYRKFYESDAKAQKAEIARLVNEYATSSGQELCMDILKHVRIHERCFGVIQDSWFKPTLGELFKSYKDVAYKQQRAKLLSDIFLRVD